MQVSAPACLLHVSGTCKLNNFKVVFSAELSGLLSLVLLGFSHQSAGVVSVLVLFLSMTADQQHSDV